MPPTPRGSEEATTVQQGRGRGRVAVDRKAGCNVERSRVPDEQCLRNSGRHLRYLSFSHADITPFRPPVRSSQCINVSNESMDLGDKLCPGAGPPPRTAGAGHPPTEHAALGAEWPLEHPSVQALWSLLLGPWRPCLRGCIVPLPSTLCARKVGVRTGMPSTGSWRAKNFTRKQGGHCPLRGIFIWGRA